MSRLVDQPLHLADSGSHFIGDCFVPVSVRWYSIRATVHTHKEDLVYLEEPFRGQVNGRIQSAYQDRGRYDELADDKYKDPGGIFDIMAVTVIDNHLEAAV